MVGSLPVSSAAGPTETVSFDAQMAALGSSAAQTVAAPVTGTGVAPVPTNSAAVFARPEVASSLATVPACADEAALFSEQGLTLMNTGEPASATLDETDEEETTGPGDNAEGGADASGTSESLIMGLLAAQQTAVTPVRAEPVPPRQNLESETSDVADCGATSAGCEEGMPTPRRGVRVGGQAFVESRALGAGSSADTRTVEGRQSGAAQPVVVTSAGSQVLNDLQVSTETGRAMPRDVSGERVGASRFELSSSVQPQVAASPSSAESRGTTAVSGKASMPGDVTSVEASSMPTPRRGVRVGGQAFVESRALGAGSSADTRTVEGRQSGAAQPVVVTSAGSQVLNDLQVSTETGRAMPRDVSGERVGASRFELSSSVQPQVAASPSSAESRGTTAVSGKASMPGDVTSVEASNVARVLQTTSSQETLPTAKVVDATADAESEPSVVAEANSAGPVLPASASVRGMPASFAERKILNAGYKSLVEESGVAGIAGAKRYRAMISDITSTAGSMTPSAEHAVAGAVSAVAQGLQVADVAATEAMAPVNRAFEAVQDAVENLKASRQNVVEVTLSEGQDSPLHIRIEYRDGVVHTAFRTESPELREHLARDWQSSMSGLTTTDSSVRLADPVFSTPNSTSRDTGLDMGGQYARQQQSQQSPSQTTSSSGGLRHAGSETSSAASSMGSSAAPQSARPETARYLHTLA